MRLENEKYSLEVGLHAAEITSFKDKETGIEYMWDGNPQYWAGKNPTLFPVIGSSFNKKYWFEGKETTMGNHGFTRHAEFTLKSQTENSVTMSLKDNEETYKQYPFHFELEVTDKLEGNRCTVIYNITNLDDHPMPFAFGLHPAFRCPLEEGKQFSDYRVEFDSTVKPVKPFGPVEEGEPLKSIPLNYEDFKKYPTFVFENLISPFATLTDGTHGVKISMVGYDTFAIWTPMAPFVCLEPWQPTHNSVDQDLPFMERDASRIVQPGRTYTTTYTIEIF